MTTLSTQAPNSRTGALDSPLLRLQASGQSPWLDFVDRNLIESGQLARLVSRGDVTGVTTNPSIFERAIANARDYEAEIAVGDARHPESVYEDIAVADVRAAADVLRPVFDRTQGRDGYVSFEVSPRLARYAAATVADAKRLWTMVDRPNLMIKVPGTKAGLEAVRRLVADGLHVNVTLLFSVAQYREALGAYLAGIEDRLDAGNDVSHIASVASFFVSRIDADVDARLEKIATEGDVARRASAQSHRSLAAIANANLAYETLRSSLDSVRWQNLAAAGARPQRLLWASTGVKDARLRDVRYVEALIGENTVNTMPPATLDAFRDHGLVRTTLLEDTEGARATISALERLGISLADVSDRLLAAGLLSFERAYDSLLASIAARHGTAGRGLSHR